MPNIGSPTTSAAVSGTQNKHLLRGPITSVIKRGTGDMNAPSVSYLRQPALNAIKRDTREKISSLIQRLKVQLYPCLSLMEDISITTAEPRVTFDIEAAHSVLTSFSGKCVLWFLFGYGTQGPTHKPYIYPTLAPAMKLYSCISRPSVPAPYWKVILLVNASQADLQLPTQGSGLLGEIQETHSWPYLT